MDAITYQYAPAVIILFLLLVVCRALFVSSKNRRSFQLQHKDEKLKADKLETLLNHRSIIGDVTSQQPIATPSRVGGNADVIDFTAPSKSSKKTLDGRRDEIAQAISLAENHILYGKQSDAIKVLKTAITRNPLKIELRLKLVDLYAAEKDIAGLTQQELDLEAMGDGEALNKIRAVLAEIDADSTINTDISPKTEELSSELAKAELPDANPTTSEQTKPTAQILQLPDPKLNGSTDRQSRNKPKSSLQSASGTVHKIGLVGNSFRSSSAKEDLSFLAGSNEAHTKLELAKAYIDIDDYDAALEMLEEVVLEGDDNQRREAAELIENFCSGTSTGA